MDVHNVLHGDLDEEVYMKLPLGFTISIDEVCKLKKSLYGLRQAQHCWFSNLSASLKRYGFVQSYFDYSLSVYSANGVRLNVLVYVDDLIIACNDSEASMKYSGNCNIFLKSRLRAAQKGYV
ncbi:UNVERIFIED_CONTAM: Copia protein [Sesamum angustifolium]|uniref:Copia protein n=1 Tax=Sesamum angustifolium TaxID=2727405 RepID=A0AAW2J7C6_9LAMI